VREGKCLQHGEVVVVRGVGGGGISQWGENALSPLPHSERTNEGEGTEKVRQGGWHWGWMYMRGWLRDNRVCQGGVRGVWRGEWVTEGGYTGNSEMGRGPIFFTRHLPIVLFLHEMTLLSPTILLLSTWISYLFKAPSAVIAENSSPPFPWGVTWEQSKSSCWEKANFSRAGGES
jgi:hypothetical protein